MPEHDLLTSISIYDLSRSEFYPPKENFPAAFPNLSQKVSAHRSVYNQI